MVRRGVSWTYLSRATPTSPCRRPKMIQSALAAWRPPAFGRQGIVFVRPHDELVEPGLGNDDRRGAAITRIKGEPGDVSFLIGVQHVREVREVREVATQVEAPADIDSDEPRSPSSVLVRMFTAPSAVRLRQATLAVADSRQSLALNLKIATLLLSGGTYDHNNNCSILPDLGRGRRCFGDDLGVVGG